jgi:cyclopropane fatty-acyl-phospholipid synthase-like methyltransferase
MIGLFIGKKKPEYYKNLLIKADLNLHEQIAAKVQNKINVGGKILDLGAGEGALSERLFDLGFHVIAADKDEENFKCKNVIFSKINFDKSDEISNFVEKYEGQFDAVLGVEVIEHVQDQWQYVRQLMKMAKPGGLVLITTPNTTSWYSRWIFLITGRFHQFADADLSYGHINPISAWELNLILKETNAVDIEIEPAGTLPAIYLGGVNRVTLLSLITLPLRPLMKGFLDGWCIMATARKVK